MESHSPTPAAPACLRPLHGFTLVELLVVVAVVGALVGLLLPAVQSARESSRRAACASNLRQLAIAFHNHENARKLLPPAKRLFTGAITACEPKMAHRSWAPDVLPFAEEGSLLASYNPSNNWYDNEGGVAVNGGVAGALDENPTGNRALVRTHLKLMLCPSCPYPVRIQDKIDSPRKTGACGDYFVVAGTGTSFNANASLPSGSVTAGPGPTEEWRDCGSSAKRPRSTLAKISDGLSKTILLAECAGREDVWRGRTRYPANGDKAAGAACVRAQGGAWATNDNAYAFGDSSAGWCSSGPISGPIDRALMRVNGSNESGWLMYGFHAGGANVAMADGAVLFVAESTAAQVLGQLATRAGGEAASLD